MGGWISREKALQEAKVNEWQAKKYLAAFSRIAPNAFLSKGQMVSPEVPFLLEEFKKLEMLGMSIGDIEKEVRNKIFRRSESKVCNDDVKKMIHLINLIIESMRTQNEAYENAVIAFQKKIIDLEQRISSIEATVKSS